MYKNNNTIKTKFIKEAMLMFPYSKLIFPCSPRTMHKSDLSKLMCKDHEVFAWFMDCLLSGTEHEMNAKLNNLAFFLGYDDFDNFMISVSSVKDDIKKFISRINSKMNLLYGKEWGLDELNMFSMIKLGLSLNDLHAELCRNLNNIKSELFYNLDLKSIDISNCRTNLFYKTHDVKISGKLEIATKTRHFYNSFLNERIMKQLIRLIDMNYVYYNGSIINIDRSDFENFTPEKIDIDIFSGFQIFSELCETNSAEFERNGSDIHPFKWAIDMQTNIIWKELVKTFIYFGGIDAISQDPLYEKYMDDDELYAFITFLNGVIIPIPIRILGIQKFGDKYYKIESGCDKETEHDSYNKDNFFSKFYFKINSYYTLNAGILEKFISSNPVSLLKFIFPLADIFVLNMKDIIYVLNNYLCDKKIDRIAMGIYRLLDNRIMLNDYVYINMHGIKIKKKIR